MIIALKDFIRSIRQTFHHVCLKIFTKEMTSNKAPILIVAPHPDDETFGCGGLITQKIKNGSDVYILFLTNGEKSLSTVPEAELIQMRRTSAINAVKLLGVSENNIHWMDLPDGSAPRLGSPEFNTARDSLLNLIQTLQVDEVFATHYLDGWSDHIAAYELSLEALKKLDQHIDLCVYWVWAWYYLGITQTVSLSWNKIFLLPIHSVFDSKQKALQVYFDAKTPAGDPYMGNLPPMFLKAFEWPYEVYEKVEYK
jgi:LmbE family N-acetylglucosaminyl deacetylase